MRSPRHLTLQSATTTASGTSQTAADVDARLPFIDASVQVSLASGATADVIVQVQIHPGAEWVDAATWNALDGSAIWASDVRLLFDARVKWSNLTGGALSAHVSCLEE